MGSTRIDNPTYPEGGWWNGLFARFPDALIVVDAGVIIGHLPNRADGEAQAELAQWLENIPSLM